jgi:hypothetical protein
VPDKVAVLCAGANAFLRGGELTGIANCTALLIVLVFDVVPALSF